MGHPEHPGDRRDAHPLGRSSSTSTLRSSAARPRETGQQLAHQLDGRRCPPLGPGCRATGRRTGAPRAGPGPCRPAPAGTRRARRGPPRAPRGPPPSGRWRRRGSRSGAVPSAPRSPLVGPLPRSPPPIARPGGAAGTTFRISGPPRHLGGGARLAESAPRIPAPTNRAWRCPSGRYPPAGGGKRPMGRSPGETPGGTRSRGGRAPTSAGGGVPPGGRGGMIPGPTLVGLSRSPASSCPGLNVRRRGRPTRMDVR